MKYPPALTQLIRELGRLPGIGPKSAQRLAFHLLRTSEEDAFGLADAIREVKERIGLCETCFNLAEGPVCAICADARRDEELICVVEEPGDVIPIERTSEYRGRYHVLGGTLSALDEVGPEDLGIPRLLGRVADENVTEVILALNATVEGQTTAHYIAEALEGSSVAVTGLAHGVPIGGELDFLDDGTISAALRARRRL